MKKKVCLEDVLSCVHDTVDVSVLYTDGEEYTVPEGSDWFCIIPYSVQCMSVKSISSINNRLFICVGTCEEVRG